MADAGIIGGRYEIVHRIGQGGMGEVYRGRDVQTGEPVAIKALKPEIVSDEPGLVERFEREGEILRKLNHPSIVKLLATIREEDRHYLIMEFVEGGTLADLLRKQPLIPIRRVLEIALDLADALTRAHRLGVVHRDIKPGNVLIAADRTPRLTDFGTAFIGDRSRLTEEGSVIGTYAYLSPEACNGLDLDARADIWSFGVVLYEMLAGRRPFEQTQPGSIVTAILTRDPGSLADLRPDVPPALVSLVERMMEKDRDQRIDSVRRVGAELESIIREADAAPRLPKPAEGLPDGSKSSRFADSTPQGKKRTRPGVPVAPETPLLQPAPRRANRLRIGLLVATLIALAALAGVSLLRGAPAPDTPSPALVEPVAPGEIMVLVAQFEPVEGAAQRDVTRFVVDNLTQTLDQGVPFSPIRIRTYPGVITDEAEAHEAAEANAATVIVWGNYSDTLIELEVQIGVTDAFPHAAIPREALEEAANVRVRLADERQQSIAPQVLGVLAVLQSADGDGYELMRTMAILDLIDVQPAEIVGTSVASHTQRSMAQFYQSWEARNEITQAIELDASNPILYAQRAAVSFRLSLYDETQQDIESAARLGPPDWAMPLYLRGNLVLRGTDPSFLSRIDEAVTTYDQIVERRPEDWFPLHMRGALHYLNGDYDSARADYDRVLTMQPNANFPYAFSTMLALREGDLGQAAALMNTVLAQFPDPTFGNRILATTSGDMGPTNIFGPLFSAYGNWVLGQYAAMIDDTRLALLMNDRLPDLYLMQGFAQCNLGDDEAAEEAYTQAITLDADFMALYLLRADVRHRQGNVEGVQQDAAVLQQSSLGDALYPYVQAMVFSGDVSCQNLFAYAVAP